MNFGQGFVSSIAGLISGDATIDPNSPEVLEAIRNIRAKMEELELQVIKAKEFNKKQSKPQLSSKANRSKQSAQESFVIKQLEKIDFIKDLIDEGNFDVAYALYKQFEYVKAKPGEVVINYGDEGDRFYVIMKGAVEVYIPCVVQVKLTEMEYIKLLNLKSSLILEVNDTKNFEIPEVAKLDEEAYKKIDIFKIMAKLDQKDQSKALVIKDKNGNIISTSKKKESSLAIEYKIRYLRKVSKLYEGSSFGELALISSNAKRAATIISVRHTEFGTLSKAQFSKILGKIYEDRLNMKLEILDLIPFTKEYSKKFKIKLTFFMDLVNVAKDTVLYDEGDTTKDLYFVISGEFEATKVIKIHEEEGKADLEYLPLEPSEDVRNRWHEFFEKYPNV